MSEGDGARGRTTPVTVELNEAGVFEFALEYEEGGKRYEGRTTVEAKARGKTKAVVALAEVIDTPAPAAEPEPEATQEEEPPAESEKETPSEEPSVEEPPVAPDGGTVDEPGESAVPPRGTRAGETRNLMLPGGASMAMVWCPAGRFLMGSPAGEKGRYDDELQHWVTLTKGFWMAKNEVTQRQWKSVMGYNPSLFIMDELPVANVTWNECSDFCRKLGLQLPTEAEWEYACRAGRTDAFGVVGDSFDAGWLQGNSGAGPHPVGKKRPNAWGLYDMHGNVWEWCGDRLGNYLPGEVTNPLGPAVGSWRVVRGGSFMEPSAKCRSASRGGNWPGVRNGATGFRPVLRPE